MSIKAKITTAREHMSHHEEAKDRHYIGKVSNAVLQQRFYQLMINWNPSNSENKQIEYSKKLKETVKSLTKLEIMTSILTKYNNQMDREFFQLVKTFL